MTRVVVVGAGFGGLAAAYALQARGCSVTLVERRAKVGGKARNHVVGGHAVPGGPTVLTLRHVFDQLFDDAGERFDDHVGLRPLDKLAHHRWSAHETLNLYRDVDRSTEAVAAFAGPAEADAYRRFVADAAQVYGAVERPFIHNSKPDLFALARATGPFGARKIKPFNTYWSAVGRHFRDPRLHQLFGRYATYCGASPFAAPATLMLIAHAEQRGVWAVDGGTAAVAKAMAKRFRAHGGTIITGEEVGEILTTRNAVSGVALNDKELPADAVVMNGDVAAIGAGLLGRRVSGTVAQVPERSRSLSAVAICYAARASETLDHHTVLFSRDYPAEFKALFQAKTMPSEPTIYVCAPQEGSAGREQPILIVMNAPATGDRTSFDKEAIQQCETQVQSRLRRCGIRLDVTSRTITTPSDFAAMLPGTGGALYGRASHGWTASFQRPAIRTKIRGLYLAGGSTHPGPGVPMAVLSGTTAAGCLLADFALQNRSRPAVISGGISTVSARMVSTPSPSSPSSVASFPLTTPGPDGVIR